jgi:Family of unknown function (DUF6090)
MEHEVQGHVKKVYKVWKDPHKNAWETFKEIAIEIGIIVFAITLSIWFHSWSEKRHDKEQVVTFLKDLKIDLNENLKEFEAQKKQYQYFQSAFNSIFEAKSKKDFPQDSIIKYLPAIQQTDAFITRTGQYESFKSAGKLINIEDKKVLTDLTGLYEEDIPQIKSNIFDYNTVKFKMQDQAIAMIQMNEQGVSNLDEVFLVPRVKIYCQILTGTNNIQRNLDNAITKSKYILVAIEKLK